MARIRLPLVYGPSGLIPPAPTFQAVAGSFQPADNIVSDGNSLKLGFTPAQLAAANPTVLVDVPDEDVTAGALDPVKIKQRYPNHWLLTSGVIK